MAEPVNNAGTWRSVGLVGPMGAGKTTLLESLLHVAGRTTRKGRVADGTTVGDASPEARARQMGTEVTAAWLEGGPEGDGGRLTLLDCPGSVELSSETRHALAGLDLAAVVVEPVAERIAVVAPLLQFLDANDIPHVVFINKMDRSEARFRDLIDALRRASGRPVVPHQYAIGRGDDLLGYIDLVTENAYGYNANAPSAPIPLPADYEERERAARAEMLETLADFDDELLEELLEDRTPSEDVIRKDLQKTLGADQVVPVFIGVAEKDMGVRRFLDCLLRETPPPDVRAGALGLAGEGPALAGVLKTYHQHHAGKLSLVRVWRGRIRDGMPLGGMRIGGIVRLFGGQQEAVGEAGPGEIVALARMDEARTGQMLEENGPARPGPDSPLQPMFGYAVRALNRGDDVKLSGAFAKLVDEDPGLSVVQDPGTGEMVLWGQGEMHLKIALDRLRTKHHVELETRPPGTPYRETIRKGAAAHGRHKKQSGGHGQFGDVKIDIAPLPRGQGFAFESRVVGGSVPRQYVPAVEAGAREHLQKGPLGFPVVDVGVALIDGQFHSVDSNELSFKMATGLALKEGLPECGPVLLEPILKVTVSVPAEQTSRALQILTQKRGQILGYEAKDGWNGWDQIEAFLPQAEMHDLVVLLRSATQGVGFFAWGFDHMDEVPDRLVQDVVGKQSSHAA